MMRPDQKDKDKVLASHKGDEGAFRLLYDRYWPKLFIYAMNVLEDQSVCEDIVQEVFVSLWQKSDAVPIDNVSAYLFQAVKFQIFKHLRHGKIAQRHLNQITFLQSHNPTEAQLNAQELETAFTRLIDRLPERCRQIFILSRSEHLTNQEIAERLGLSLQTVKNQITKALAFLRKELPDDVPFALLFFLLF